MGENENKTVPEIKRPVACYQKGTFLVKNAKRAEQLERHDRQARACYEAIENGIEHLKALVEKIRNGEYISECR